MITFRTFLFEDATDRMVAIEPKIDQALQAKTIYKPEYEELKRIVDRGLEEKYRAEVASPHIHGRGAEIDALKDPKLVDLVWSTVSSARETLSLKNKIKSVKDKTNHMFVAIDSFYKQNADLAQKIIDLKQYVVTATQKRAEAKQVAAIEKEKRHTDSGSLVNALTVFIDAFVKEAESRAGKYYDDMHAMMIKAGGLDAIAPKPNSKMSTEDFRNAAKKREFFKGITIVTKQKYMENAGNDARADYMEWVDKITKKIGKPVIDAKMSGSPWTGSLISVTTEDGETQHWSTTMIINQSKYGKLFNQFPTRKK